MPKITVKYIARVAPNAAPLAVPNVDELARGLLSNICITCPLTASDEPTTSAAMILGALMSAKMVCLISRLTS